MPNLADEVRIFVWLRRCLPAVETFAPVVFQTFSLANETRRNPPIPYHSPQSAEIPRLLSEFITIPRLTTNRALLPRSFTFLLFVFTSIVGAEVSQLREMVLLAPI